MVRCSAITGDVFSRHEIENHDENSARLNAAGAGIPDGIPIIEPQIAREEDLLRVHTCSHVNMIREFSSHGGQHFIDQNTYVNGETFEVASYAAGAAIDAVHRSIDGEHSFALVRPPGHHAEPDKAMGFCIFNNAAIAASVALDRVDRI
ncbi:MAG: histone deacetylase, partial [Methanomicrobiales archaeon HGW-Methanomicrobiales-5]